MANPDREGEGSPNRGTGVPKEQTSDVSGASSAPVAASKPELPGQSPLFHAEQAERYDRQDLISQYQDAFDCRLIVLIDAIFGYSITLFEELIYDADPAQDMHLLLWTPGGDGETAVRLARAAQARSREFTVIVPDIAKSAGTILALGAHHILLGPVSDLGPIDPQFQLGQQGELVSAKDIIAAVDDASDKIQQAPDTYPLYASLLTDVTALMVQQARAALARTGDLLVDALRANPDRSPSDVESLRATLQEPLIQAAKSHGAIFGWEEANGTGLPVELVDPSGLQWQVIWRLWTKYFARGSRFYEGARASKELPPWSQEAQLPVEPAT